MTVVECEEDGFRGETFRLRQASQQDVDADYVPLVIAQE